MGVYATDKLPLDLLNAFRAAGFIDYTYKGQDGVFLRKEMDCGDMPNVKATIINGDYITDDSRCVIELVPNGNLQMYIADDDYHECYDFDNTKEGFLALAHDAGVNITGV